MELVGVASSRDRANFGDSVVRLQVEFLTKGIITDNQVGGWDGKKTGFIAAAGRPYGPGVALSPLSTIGGPQYESQFQIVHSSGAWWIGHNGNWLGYYPASLFDLMPSSACEALWYGEIFDPTPTDWTWTDMGSGMFSSSGAGSAASFKNPFYWNVSGIAYWPDGAVNTPPNDSACYTRSNLLVGGPGSDRTLYVGGPGGDAPGCN
jgi:hypothetical protein